ncbi:MAG: ISL3 family transposase [Lachnospiraceae bacterium]|nr:ISL3 family transposase [Lachnospiraceae bacterium]
MNSITELLDLENLDIIISDITIQGTTKTLTLETRPCAHFCPSCGFKMHSKGIKKRTIKHPILQDTYELILLLKQRRWKCTNPECAYDISESFKFVNKRRRTTNATDMLIVGAFRNLMETSVSIANRFHVSDTHVLEVFDRYVKMDRLPLTDAICIDEVFLDMDEHCKYALVIQDFHTGDPIDLLRSRRTNVTEPYFVSVPPSERNAVKYLISDMYNPYISYVDKYFPNAVSVIDSFHVIQWITRLIDNYIRQLLKKYRQRDREREEQLSFEQQTPVSLPPSDEVYLLQKYRWLILSSQANIRYRTDPRMDSHFRCLMNTFDYEDALFRIDPNLRDFRDLKEAYIQFNNRNAGFPIKAREELDELIPMYQASEHDIFREFGELLEKYKDYIINSFIMVEKHGTGKVYNSRLSNGPIESINRKVKDLKRLGRGFRNFEHFRNRFLYATRKAPVLNGVSDYNPVGYFEDDEN